MINFSIGDIVRHIDNPSTKTTYGIIVTISNKHAKVLWLKTGDTLTYFIDRLVKVS